MKRFGILFFALSLFTLTMNSIAAQDEAFVNDPKINEDANACLAGGTMEGKCGDSDYLWQGGWYKIRYEYGIIGRDVFPDQYKWMLPRPEDELADVPKCLIDIGGANAATLGLASSIVEVPLSIINGQSDPNAAPGVTPYGFDWYVDPMLRYLILYTPSTASSMTLWQNGAWNGGTVSNTCPNPTPPI